MRKVDLAGLAVVLTAMVSVVLPVPASAGVIQLMSVSISPIDGVGGTFITVTTPDCDATQGINYAVFAEGEPINGTPIIAVGPIVAPGPFGIEFPGGQPAGTYQIAAYCDDLQQNPREGAAPFTNLGPQPVDPPADPLTPAPSPLDPTVGPVAADPGFTG